MTKPHEGRPPHPVYGEPLSGAPTTWAGVVFRPYRVGRPALTNVRVSDDFRIEVRSRGSYWTTYTVTVDGKVVETIGKTRDHPKYFRDQKAAAEAGVRALKAVR